MFARFTLVAVAIAAASAQPAAGQERRFTFLGDYRGLERVRGGVVLRATGGAVEIAQIANVGFRIRYTFTGSFDTTSSWAVLADSAVPGTPAVAETPEAVSVRGGGLVVTAQKRPLRLAVADTAGISLFAESFGAGHQGVRVTHVLARPAEARYFGLGEQAFPLDRTGQNLILWNTDAYGYRSESTPLYSSIPFYVVVRSGRAYGVYYDNSYESEFDFGAKLKEHVGFTAAGGPLTAYVFPGPSMQDVLAEYTRLLGRSPLPPRWSLGYQQSRYSYYPDSELTRVAHEFRNRGIPCDVLYLDIHYMDGYRVFTWHPQRFPDPRGLLTSLAAQGFKVVTIVDPGVKVDSAYDVYRQLLAQRGEVTWPDGSPYVGRVWPGPVLFPDFSLAATRQWWGDLHRRLIDPGVAGIWNDMNEPANFGGRTLPDVAEFDQGRSNHAEFHNLYALLEARATYEGLRRLQPDKRPFVLTRAGLAGMQRYTSIWTGDNTATWEHLGLAVEMVLGLGISGVPFAGADVGGFSGAPDAQLFTRFLQASTFFPFLRTHSDYWTPRREPWSFGPVIETALRAMIRLRYRLLPHLYTAFAQHARDGRPVARPLVFDWQGDTVAYRVSDEFTFGDHLLVAPVIRENQETRPVYLPAGRWYRFPSDSAYDGGRTVIAHAPGVHWEGQDEASLVAGVPIFVRAGAVIPMQEVEQYLGERRQDTLELHVWDGGAETSELYEDAGEGFAYRDGAWRLTRFQTRSDDRALEVALTATGRYDGAASDFRVAVHGLSRAPAAVTVDGSATQARWDANARVAAFDVRPDAHTVRVER
jgi:alpha-glucosidase